MLNNSVEIAFVMNSKNKNFFIKVKYDNFEYIRDNSIADIFGVSPEEYIQKLSKEYNGKYTNHGMYFISEKNAENAKEWIESLLMLLILKDN